MSTGIARPRRVAIALAGVALVATSVPLAGPAAPAPKPVLLRDRQASIFTALPAGHCLQGQANTTPAGQTCVQPDTEVEPSIGANPLNPLNAVAVFQSGRVDAGGDADNGYAVTLDGGKTWTHGLLPGLTKAVGGPFDRASDPVVAFGPRNIVYANSLVFDDTGNALRSGLAVNVSRDGGRTWGAPVFLQDDMIGGLIDKNWIGVDLGTGAGHHTGRIYVVWDRVAPVLAAYSDDEGATWQTGPTGLGYVVYPGQGIGALPLVLRDGSLAVMYQTDVSVLPVLHPSPGDELAEPIPGVSKFVISTALAAGSLPTGAPLVFGPPVSVATNQVNPIRQQRACDGTQAAVVDQASGRLYIVWTDGRARTDGVNDVAISRSDDNGITWTAPRRVNTGPVNDFVDHWCGAVDVGPAGDVRVSYRTRKEAAGETRNGSTFSVRVGTFYQESLDHGDTFTDPISVSTVVSDVRFAAESRGGAFLGDYEQLAAAGPYTYVVREEPVRVKPSEAATFPPSFHHQRTWVAVVGPASAKEAVQPVKGKPPKPVVKGTKTTRPAKHLPATGVGDGWLGLWLLAAALAPTLTRRAHRVLPRYRAASSASSASTEQSGRLWRD